MKRRAVKRLRLTVTTSPTNHYSTSIVLSTGAMEHLGFPRRVLVECSSKASRPFVRVTPVTDESLVGGSPVSLCGKGLRNGLVHLLKYTKTPKGHYDWDEASRRFWFNNEEGDEDVSRGA